MVLAQGKLRAGSPPDGSADASQRPWTQSAGLGLVVAVGAMALLPVSVTGTNLAFGSVEADFAGTSRAVLSWILSGYSIVLAAFTLLGGQLADRLGSRRMFVLGLAVFCVSSIAAGLAPNPAVLILARVGQGVGGALIVPSSLTMAIRRFPPERRPVAIGVWTAAFPIGSSLAPIIASVILEVGDWHGVFLVPAPIAAILLLLTWLQGELPQETDPRAGARPTGRPDLVGIVIGTVAVGLAALGIVQGPRWGWSSVGTVAALVVATLLVPVFVLWSRRQTSPLIDLELFRLRTVWSANLGNIFVSMIGMSVWLLWPLFLVQVWGYSQLGVGLAMTPTPALGGFLSVVASRWAQRWGYKTFLAPGAVVIALANVWLLVRLDEQPDYWLGMFPALLLFGVGMGLTFAPLNGAALVGVPTSKMGQANAAFSTGRFLSGAIGIASAVAALGDRADGDVLAGFDRAFGLMIGLSLVAVVVLALAWPREA